MKNLRKRQLYITLAYFIPVLIMISVSTFYILQMHRTTFTEIRDSLLEQSIDAEYLKLHHQITEIVTEDDWENLSEAQIDEKLALFGIDPIGDVDDPLYYYTPEQIQELSNEEYNRLVPDEESPSLFDPLIGIDFTDDGEVEIEYVSLEEYEATTNQLYDATFRIIIISSLVLTLLFGYLSYRLSIIVMRPIVRAFEQQQQFMSDISHELRTPVAVLQSEVDVVKRLPEITVKRQQRFVTNVSTTTGQLSHIVRQLMTLGRLDIAREINRESLDLSRYVQDSLMQFTQSAQERNISFKSENLDTSKIILAEHGFLSQVIMVVMDNAIKYSHKDTDIQVSIIDGKKSYALKITNATDAIPQEQLDQLFERMYRVSESRHDGGLGLGLSIAERIMHAFKGSIQLENTAHGITTTLQFPKA